MATKTWTGGTGTWDSTTGTHWSGGTAPVAGDAIVFDGSSGGGTVTADTSIASIAFLSITAGAFTGTLDFTGVATMNFGSVSFTGSGTRTINMGSGTWTLTGTATVFDVGTITGLTPTFSNAAIVCNATTTSVRTFNGGGQSFGSLTVGDNTSKAMFSNFAGANTFGSITIGSGTTFACPQGVTQTITGALTINGTSSAQSGLQSSAPLTNAATISVGTASTATWTGFFRVTKAGAGSITATNSFELGNVSGISITVPSGGGGGAGAFFGA